MHIPVKRLGLHLSPAELDDRTNYKFVNCSAQDYDEATTSSGDSLPPCSPRVLSASSSFSVLTAAATQSPLRPTTVKPGVQRLPVEVPLSLKVHGVDYYALTADNVLTARLVAAVRVLIAHHAGVDLNALAFALSAGSVKIDVKVETEDMEAAEVAHANLAALNPVVLQAAVAQAIRATPGVELITVGPIHATGLVIGSPTQVAEETENQQVLNEESPVTDPTEEEREQFDKSKSRISIALEQVETRALASYRNYERAAEGTVLEDDRPGHSSSQKVFTREVTNSRKKIVSAETAAAAAQAFKALLLSRERTFSSAWRRIFDPNATGHVTLNQFCNACRYLGFKGSFREVWKHLNADGDGMISLAELDFDEAHSLGVLRARMVMIFGSVSKGAEALRVVVPRRVLQQEFCERMTVTKLSTWDHALTLFNQLCSYPSQIQSGNNLAGVDAQAFKWLDAMGTYLPLPELGRIEPGTTCVHGENAAETAAKAAFRAARESAAIAETAIVSKLGSSVHRDGSVRMAEFTKALKDTDYRGFGDWVLNETRFHHRREETEEEEGEEEEKEEEEEEVATYLDIYSLRTALLKFYLDQARGCSAQQATKREPIHEKLHREAKDWHERKQLRADEGEKPVALLQKESSDPLIFERLHADSKVHANRRAREAEERWRKQQDLASVTAGEHSDPSALTRLMGAPAPEGPRAAERKKSVDHFEQHPCCVARRVHLWQLLPLEELLEACELYGLDHRDKTRDKLIQLLNVWSLRHGLEVNQNVREASERLDSLHEDARKRRERLAEMKDLQDQREQTLHRRILVDGPRSLELEVGDTVRALEGRGFQKGDEVFYRAGDVGCVTKAFEKHGEPKLQIYWDFTEKSTIIDKGVWHRFFEIIEKSEAKPDTRAWDPEAIQRLHEGSSHKRWTRKPPTDDEASGEFVCERCKTECSEDSKFCRKCGRPRPRPVLRSKPRATSIDSGQSTACFRLYLDGRLREKAKNETLFDKAHAEQAQLDETSVHRHRRRMSDNGVFERLHNNALGKSEGSHGKSVFRSVPISLDMPDRQHEWMHRDDVRNTIANAASRCIHICNDTFPSSGQIEVPKLLSALRGGEFNDFAAWMERGRNWKLFSRDGGCTMVMPGLRAALMEFYTQAGVVSRPRSAGPERGGSAKGLRPPSGAGLGRAQSARAPNRPRDAAPSAAGGNDTGRDPMSDNRFNDACKSCGASLEGANFCKVCGASRDQQPNNLVCPNGHELVSFFAPLDSWPCSLCMNNKFEQGDRFMSCHECGYFVCQSCIGPNRRRSISRPRNSFVRDKGSRRKGINNVPGGGIRTPGSKGAGATVRRLDKAEDMTSQPIRRRSSSMKANVKRKSLVVPKAERMDTHSEPEPEVPEESPRRKASVRKGPKAPVPSYG